MPKIGLCVSCKLEKEVHKDRKTGELWCYSCKGAERYESKIGWIVCSKCKKFRKSASKRSSICMVCKVSSNSQGYCASCGLEKQISKHNGKPICQTCRSKIFRQDQSKWKRCFYCPDEIGPLPVACYDEDGLAVCYKHYRHHRKLHPKK